MAPSGKWIEGIGPETAVADAARRSLEPRLAIVAHTLPLAAYLAEHDIEHVHRLRVATRRAAAALKLYRDWLPKKSAGWIKKRLRQIRRAASEARDLDVLIQRLQREASAEAEPTMRFLAENRAALQPSIVELADKMRREDRFIRKTARLFSKLERSNQQAESTSSERLGDWAPQQLANFRSAFVELLPDGSDNIAALHQFRIRTKALRYAIELLAPAFGQELRHDTYPVVEQLQEQLGKITDHIAAIRLFAEWEADSTAHTPMRDASYLDAEKAREIEDLEAFRQWWTPEKSDALVQALTIQTAMSSPPG